MGMLDDAFKPDKPSSTRKRPQTKSVVPYGAGRQGTMKGAPLYTPPPKQSTSLTVYKPKQVAIRRPPPSKASSSSFDFSNPFGSSQPLGSSSGVSSGKRHKPKRTGGITTPRRGGGIKVAVSQAVGKTKRAAGSVGRGVGRGVDTAERHYIRAIGGGTTKAQKQKERKSIGKQVRKGIHSTLFKGKKKLI